MGKNKNRGKKSDQQYRSQSIVTPDTIVWFGKHKGQKASGVPKDYWRWVNENFEDLTVSPELLPGRITVGLLTDNQKDIVIEAIEDVHDKYSQQMNGDGYYEGIVEGLNIACGIIRVIK